MLALHFLYSYIFSSIYKYDIFIYRYNECWYVGNQAIEDIHNRACYEAYPNVMLVTNAIRNSASSGAPGNCHNKKLTDIIQVYI